MNAYKRFGAVFVLALVLVLVSSSLAAAQSYVYLPSLKVISTRSVSTPINGVAIEGNPVSISLNPSGDCALDAINLQAAMDDLSTGGELVLDGYYCIDRQVFSDFQADVTIRGSGPDNTTIEVVGPFQWGPDPKNGFENADAIVLWTSASLTVKGLSIVVLEQDPTPLYQNPFRLAPSTALNSLLIVKPYEGASNITLKDMDFQGSIGSYHNLDHGGLEIDGEVIVEGRNCSYAAIVAGEGATNLAVTMKDMSANHFGQQSFEVLVFFGAYLDVEFKDLVAYNTQHAVFLGFLYGTTGQIEITDIQQFGFLYELVYVDSPIELWDVNPASGSLEEYVVIRDIEADGEPWPVDPCIYVFPPEC